MAGQFDGRALLRGGVVGKNEGPGHVGVGEIQSDVERRLRLPVDLHLRGALGRDEVAEFRQGRVQRGQIEREVLVAQLLGSGDLHGQRQPQGGARLVVGEDPGKLREVGSIDRLADFQVDLVEQKAGSVLDLADGVADPLRHRDSLADRDGSTGDLLLHHRRVLVDRIEPVEQLVEGIDHAFDADAAKLHQPVEAGVEVQVDGVPPGIPVPCRRAARPADLPEPLGIDDDRHLPRPRGHEPGLRFEGLAQDLPLDRQLHRGRGLEPQRPQVLGDRLVVVGDDALHVGAEGVHQLREVDLAVALGPRARVDEGEPGRQPRRRGAVDDRCGGAAELPLRVDVAGRGPHLDGDLEGLLRLGIGECGLVLRGEDEDPVGERLAMQWHTADDERPLPAPLGVGIFDHLQDAEVAGRGRRPDLRDLDEAVGARSSQLPDHDRLAMVDQRGERVAGRQPVDHGLPGLGIGEP